MNSDLRLYRTVLKQLAPVMKDTPAALAAVDIALHDLVSQFLQIPLADMLGRVHQSLPTSITIGIMGVEETLAEAEEYQGMGFEILKVKIGHELAEDIERLAKLREKFGSRIRIRVDANQGYSLDQYRTFCQQVRLLDLEFVEQPLAASNIRDMRALPRPLRQWTAADESLLGPASAVNYLGAPRPFGIFTIKLMKCGGVAPALDIASMADHAGIELMWGCNDESIVSISAALHAALACPATRYLDLDGSLDLARDVVSGGFKLKNGRMTVHDHPGLGVTRLPYNK
jgi:L-alanine-DL-glutamate epimerase-like enolase superfamily enzyme